jgi:hypothetical protein
MAAGDSADRVQAAARPARVEIGAVAAIVLVVAVVYARALSAPFFFDDANTILLNPTVRAPSSLRIMLAGTRPVLNLSYAVTYRVSGPDPWGYHLGNIVLHAANALLLYFWLRLTLEAMHARTREAHWMAWGAALLFAVHPLQTEAVTYVSGRADVLAAFFGLAALAALAWSSSWRAHRIRTALFGAVTVVATIAAAASKESAVVMPLILLASGALLYRDGAAALRARPIVYAGLVVPWLLTAFLLVRHPEYTQTAGLAFGQSEYGISPLHYAYTQPSVIVHYLRLALLPYGQVFDYDWPVATSARDAVLPAVILVGAALVGMLSWRRSPLYPFAVLWVIATLAPTSSFVPIADVIAERRMYLPLVGVAIIASLAVCEIVFALRRRTAARCLAAAAVLACAGCAALTWQRNGVWADPLLLWQDTVRKQPGNPRARTNLGIRHLQRGNVQSARIELETALDLVEKGESSHATPRHGAFAATHLALAYLELGDPVAAGAAYDIARELGAETFRELAQPLQRVATTLAAVAHGDADEQ